MSVKIRTMAECYSEGEEVEVLMWVGCAGSFDERAKKITLSLAEVLNRAGVSFAVLGSEESCTGDAAKRAGNEYLFQMQAMTNIQVLNFYQIKNIVTTCPHCYNTLKNEYPELGGVYNVIHHSQYIKGLIKSGRLTLDDSKTKNQRVTFHDPCYLGRGNGDYESVRDLIKILNMSLVEMKGCRGQAMCCGAGGAQMFKEPEKGNAEINNVRAQQALAVKPNIIITGCPFCKTMLSDGVKNNDSNVVVKDIVELM